MNKNKMKYIIIGNILLLSLCFLVLALNLLNPLSNFFYDIDSKFSASHKPNDKIVVVGIDEYSMTKLGVFPWDRKTYIPFLENLEESKAKVIAFDILFNSKSAEESDLLFANELKKYNNIILPSYADLPTTPTNINNMIVAKNLNNPLSIFKTNPAHINTLFDSDGVIRRAFLELRYSDSSIYQFAYKACEIAGYNVSQFLNYHPQKQIYIKYNGQMDDFKTISFVKVMEGDYPEDLFKDKIVLIGFTSPGYDEAITPINRNMKLVYAHANIVSQLLNDEYIYDIDQWLIFLFILIITIITIFLTWRMTSVKSIIFVFGISIFLSIFQYYIFSEKGVFLNFIYIIFTLLLVYLLNISLKSYFNIKEKEFITRQFGRYISPDLVKQIVQNQIDIKLGGITKDITILFLDVRGFTTMSEKLSPKEAVNILNLMFDMVTKNVLNNKGTIDKFIGDGAMVLFNAPLDLAEHEYLAVKTAIEIQSDMERITDEVFRNYEKELGIGIGINTGLAVVGNMGSFLRLDYTAIGDNVNIASRIESNSRSKDIFVSESTYERTKDRICYEFVNEFLMKGKTIPIKVYRAKGFL